MAKVYFQFIKVFILVALVSTGLCEWTSSADDSDTQSSSHFEEMLAFFTGEEEGSQFILDTIHHLPKKVGDQEEHLLTVLSSYHQKLKDFSKIIQLLAQDRFEITEDELPLKLDELSSIQSHVLSGLEQTLFHPFSFSHQLHNPEKLELLRLDPLWDRAVHCRGAINYREIFFNILTKKIAEIPQARDKTETYSPTPEPERSRLSHVHSMVEIVSHPFVETRISRPINHEEPHPQKTPPPMKRKKHPKKSSSYIDPHFNDLLNTTWKEFNEGRGCYPRF